MAEEWKPSTMWNSAVLYIDVSEERANLTLQKRRATEF
jgi:hypothetical protein